MFLWNRIRNHYARKGYNIQSPFVFFLVRYILFGQERYYAYQEVQMLFHLHRKKDLQKLSLLSRLHGYYGFKYVIHYGFGSLWHLVLIQKMLFEGSFCWYVQASEREKAVEFLQRYDLSRIRLFLFSDQESLPKEKALEADFIFLSEDDSFSYKGCLPTTFVRDLFVWSEQEVHSLSAPICLHFSGSLLLIYKNDVINGKNITFTF